MRRLLRRNDRSSQRHISCMSLRGRQPEAIFPLAKDILLMRTLRGFVGTTALLAMTSINMSSRRTLACPCGLGKGRNDMS
jgi:hypothetical protein